MLEVLAYFSPAASPVDNTNDGADNYPDRAEDANPDEYIRYHMTKGNQAIPGSAGNIASPPAGEDKDVLASGFGVGVTPVIGHL